MKLQFAASALLLSAAALALPTGTAAGDDCPSKCSSKAKAALASNPTSDKTIVETAVAAGNFKTLATLLQKAELVEALDSRDEAGVDPAAWRADAEAAYDQVARSCSSCHRSYRN